MGKKKSKSSKKQQQQATMTTTMMTTENGEEQPPVAVSTPATTTTTTTVATVCTDSALDNSKVDVDGTETKESVGVGVGVGVALAAAMESSTRPDETTGGEMADFAETETASPFNATKNTNAATSYAAKVMEESDESEPTKDDEPMQQHGHDSPDGHHYPADTLLTAASSANPSATPAESHSSDETTTRPPLDAATADVTTGDAAVPTDAACDSKGNENNNMDLTATTTTTTTAEQIDASSIVADKESSSSAAVDIDTEHNVAEATQEPLATTVSPSPEMDQQPVIMVINNNEPPPTGTTTTESLAETMEKDAPASTFTITKEAVVVVIGNAAQEMTNHGTNDESVPSLGNQQQQQQQQQQSVKDAVAATTAVGPSDPMAAETPCATAVVEKSGDAMIVTGNNVEDTAVVVDTSPVLVEPPVATISEARGVTPSTVVEKSVDASVTRNVEDTTVVDTSPVVKLAPATTQALAGTSQSPPQTPPPASKNADNEDIRTPVVATETENADNDGTRTPVVATETATSTAATTRIDGETPVASPSHGSSSDVNRTTTDDAGSSKLQSPPRLSGKNSSPQGVMDFHNLQEQGDDVVHHPVALFPMNSPQRQAAQLSATDTAAIPSTSLERKDSVLTDEDEAASFLPRGIQVANKVKDIYRPNEKKEETSTHGFAALTKENGLRNKQREDGLTATNVNSIRKMFDKQTPSDSSPMGLEAFNQMQAARRQQAQIQKVEALAKMHGFSEEVIAAYLKKSAQGEVDYSHLAKLQDEIDKLKYAANEIPVGMGRLEKSPHRRTRSMGEIDSSHVVDVDGVDRSDWKGSIVATALSADAADASGRIHADFRATDYRGMIFVVHHQEGLMLLRGAGADKGKSTTPGPDVVCDEGVASTGNARATQETSVAGVGGLSDNTLEPLESDSVLHNNTSTNPDVRHEGGVSTGNEAEAQEESVPVVSSNAVVELHETDSLLKSLNDTIVGIADADTPLYQLPGGRISDDDALAAAQESPNPQRQLLLAARAGAARQLYESTGIDVRSRLADLVPAILKPDCNENAESALLPNELHSNIFFFLNVTDDDFVKPGEIEAASGGVKRQDGKEEQPAVGDLKKGAGAPVVKVPAGERLLLKLSNEHSGFMFEKEPTKATELLKSDNTTLGVLSSEALELLTQQQKTLANKTSVRDAASRLDESATPFTLDRFWQRQCHPSLDGISSYRSLADAKDAVSDDAAHASENEEMASCQGGSAGATNAVAAAAAAAAAASASASSPSAAVDEELQKSLNKCACCTVM